MELRKQIRCKESDLEAVPSLNLQNYCCSLSATLCSPYASCTSSANSTGTTSSSTCTTDSTSLLHCIALDTLQSITTHMCLTKEGCTERSTQYIQHNRRGVGRQQQQQQQQVGSRKSRRACASQSSARHKKRLHGTNLCKELRACNTLTCSNCTAATIVEARLCNFQ